MTTPLAFPPLFLDERVGTQVRTASLLSTMAGSQTHSPFRRVLRAELAVAMAVLLHHQNQHHQCHAAAIAGETRLAVEIENTLVLKPSNGEPQFEKPASGVQAHCVLTSAGGYAVGLPTAQPVNASSDPAHPVPDGGDLRKNLMNGKLFHQPPRWPKTRRCCWASSARAQH